MLMHHVARLGRHSPAQLRRQLLLYSRGSKGLLEHGVAHRSGPVHAAAVGETDLIRVRVGVGVGVRVRVRVRARARVWVRVRVRVRRPRS